MTFVQIFVVNDKKVLISGDIILRLLNLIFQSLLNILPSIITPLTAGGIHISGEVISDIIVPTGTYHDVVLSLPAHPPDRASVNKSILEGITQCLMLTLQYEHFTDKEVW